MSKYFPILVNQQNVITVGIIMVVAIVVLAGLNASFGTKLERLWKSGKIRRDDPIGDRYQEVQGFSAIGIGIILLAACHQFVAYVITTVPPNWPDYVGH